MSAWSSIGGHAHQKVYGILLVILQCDKSEVSELIDLVDVRLMRKLMNDPIEALGFS